MPNGGGERESKEKEKRAYGKCLLIVSERSSLIKREAYSVYYYQSIARKEEKKGTSLLSLQLAISTAITPARLGL